MEKSKVVTAPVAMARFVGERLLGGGWANLPPLPQGEIVRPARCVRVPENIILGEE